MASRLKIERVRQDLSQAALAKKTGGVVSQAILSLMEHGRRPRPDEAVALSVALGVAVEDIFDN